jgi:hypothetical protein
MSGDDEKMWTPVTREDVTDLALLPGEMRAFRVEVRDEIRAIATALQALVRIDGKLDVVIERQNHQDKQIAAIQQEQARTAARLDALESKGRKPRKKR